MFKSLVANNQSSAPAYIPGLWACITACLIIGTICITLDLSFWRKNKKADAGQMVLEGGDVSIFRSPERRMSWV